MSSPEVAGAAARSLQHRRAHGGAALAALVIHAGVSWRWVWPAVAVVALGVGVWALVTDPGAALAPAAPAGTAQHSSRHPLRRLHRDGLLVLLAVFALAEITEGGVDTWGVLYLRNHLATGVLARGRGLHRRPGRRRHHARRRRSSARPALHPACAHHRRLRRRRRHPSRVPLTGFGHCRPGLALGAGGASLFWPLVMSTVSRMASQVVSAVGAFTAAWVYRLGRGRAHCGLGLAESGTRPWPAGPGSGLLRRRRLHPAGPLAQGRSPGHGVAWADRHDPAKHRDARRSQGPERGAAGRALRRDQDLHRRHRDDDRRASRLQSRRRGAHGGAAPGLRLPARRHPLGHRPPGLRAQAVDGAPLRLQDLEAGGRDVGLSEPGRVRARLDREQPCIDRPLLRPRDRQRVRAPRDQR